VGLVLEVGTEQVRRPELRLQTGLGSDLEEEERDEGRDVGWGEAHEQAVAQEQMEGTWQWTKE